MISVENYFDNIPKSLDYKYSDPKKYDKDDVKKRLREIFNEKCCYCESEVEHITTLHIEHYRPQEKYKWLKFEWSNLLLACPKYNQKKAMNFQLKIKKLIKKI